MSSVRDLEAVFSLVANETRLEILLALWEEHEVDEQLDPDPVPFSALRKQVGVRDSGRFHYHLDALVPEFVQNDEDGYTLTYAGGRILGAAISGVYTRRDVDFEAIPVGDCAVDGCAGSMAVNYEQGHIIFECDVCDLRNTIPAPPILVGTHDPEDEPAVFSRFNLTQLQKTVRGFCHLCSGPVDGRLDVSALETHTTDRESGDTDTRTDTRSDRQVRVIYECRECIALSHTNLVTALLDHPAVISLLHDAGIDYRAVPPWQLPQLVAVDETVLDADPVQIELVVSVDDKVLTVVVDEHLDVVEWTRHRN